MRAISPAHLVLLNLDHSPQHTVHKTPLQTSLGGEGVRDQVLHPYKTIDNSFIYFSLQRTGYETVKSSEIRYGDRPETYSMYEVCVENIKQVAMLLKL